MDSFFKKIQQQENSTFHKKEEKWWNGNAFNPLIHYNIRYPYHSGLIDISYEYRQSEFSKPSSMNGGACYSRHLFSFYCEIKVEKSLADFNISGRSLFSKLFRKSPSSLFKVNCKDPNFYKSLEQNVHLKNIFRIAENSPEFSPDIKGEMSKQLFVLTIHFSTQKENEKAVNLINEFCKNFK